MNPLFGSPMQQGPFGNVFNLIAQFNQFRQGFSGDPKAQVQNLLDSGQMSQEQFNQLSGMAQQMMPFIRR